MCSRTISLVAPLIWQLNARQIERRRSGSPLHAVGASFLTTANPVASTTTVSAATNPALAGKAGIHRRGDRC